ncbi:metal dependent phosphohydrolase [Syntrophobotulus glycolicus DSM 8271]|uniref:bis(5'-nucleosyl)-tetraphosphatase (symmetrical) n=1 Tax=Syntrophobotulus glycolicus (strain DSM 8271 / FlGlyR) TaxID=645991 RepID=F0SVG6_SYNGF|nr:bis(5'-nucleosyl)-tetraphosphatase (symmetrical) YqeK [Syntrophobotulus glycolicus]ADY56739.1 metal dependent phosphohydrolase [Syntrophobotulus glycolicus DSM 8271]
MDHPDDYRKLVQGKLSAERYQHVLGVEQVAVELAGKYSINSESASIAALTHDLEKERPWSEQKALAQALGLISCPEDLVNPQVLHGRLAAYVLEHDYAMTDIDILNAVANHTLGRPGMSALEMLIYSADLIEPGRSFTGVDNLREKLYDDLIEGTYACVGHMLAYLEQQGRPVHPLTRLAFLDLEKRTGKSRGGFSDHLSVSREV